LSSASNNSALTWFESAEADRRKLTNFREAPGARWFEWAGRHIFPRIVQQTGPPAPVGRDPEPPAPVFGDVIDDRMLQALPLAVIGEAMTVESGKAFPGGEP
jgi:hypothetical protein